MRCHKTIMFVMTCAMGLLLLTGTVYSHQFPQAARAESIGFDALAHDLFGGDAPAVVEAAPQ